MGSSMRLLLGLFLLGLGWSCTLVPGSTLLTAAVPTAERPGAQGASDLVMGLAAGLGGALAGVVVDYASFHALALGCLVVALAIGAAALVLRDSGAVSETEPRPVRRALLRECGRRPRPGPG